MSDSENKNPQQIIELDFDFNDEVKIVSEVFFKESQDILEDLDDYIVKLEARPHDEVLLQGLFRRLHTLKGSAGAVPGGQLFGSLSHEFETLLDRLRKQNVPPNKECIEIFLHSSRLLKVLAENLRMSREIYPEELSEVIELISRYGSFQLTPVDGVAAARTEASDMHDEESKRPKDGLLLSKDQMSSLMQLSSEFIVLKNSFQMLAGAKENVSLQKIQEKQSELSHSLQTLSDQFQNILDRAQKIPLKEALASLFPLVRQAAYELQKEVKFVDKGFDLEIDKSLAQDLNKAVMHMVRNSLDHGIEKPDDRRTAGKKPQGQLTIQFEEKNNVIHCLISDDGKGLDKERILLRALEKGLTNNLEAAQLPEEKIFAFIFHAGFSTKEKITTMSGRGVGMDVVQNTIDKYGGSIQIESKKGEGTTFYLKLPVPRKVLVERCLLGDWQGYALAFPLSEVSHISSCRELQITEVDHLRFCQHDHQTVPLLGLKEIYNLQTDIPLEQARTMSVVFLRLQNMSLGFLVDHIHYQTDLVIKSFGEIIKKPPGFKGNSVLTDDQIAYVVDASELQSLMQKEPA
jgi:two-component system chemotaxis sensor kinase CheA